MTGGVLVLINQAAQCRVGTHRWGAGARLPAEGDRGGCGVHILAARSHCAAPHSTRATCRAMVVILMLGAAIQSKEPALVLSVVTPVNQPDTAPGVVQWSSGPWHRLRQENICPTATPWSPGCPATVNIKTQSEVRSQISLVYVSQGKYLNI